MVEHFYVKFGDPSYIGFWDTVWKTDKQRLNSTPAIAVGVANQEI